MANEKHKYVFHAYVERGGERVRREGLQPSMSLEISFNLKKLIKCLKAFCCACLDICSVNVSPSWNIMLCEAASEEATKAFIGNYSDLLCKITTY